MVCFASPSSATPEGAIGTKAGSCNGGVLVTSVSERFGKCQALRTSTRRPFQSSQALVIHLNTPKWTDGGGGGGGGTSMECGRAERCNAVIATTTKTVATIKQCIERRTLCDHAGFIDLFPIQCYDEYQSTPASSPRAFSDHASPRLECVWCSTISKRRSGCDAFLPQDETVMLHNCDIANKVKGVRTPLDPCRRIEFYGRSAKTVSKSNPGLFRSSCIIRKCLQHKR